jgi:hypothetical protein
VRQPARLSAFVIAAAVGVLSLADRACAANTQVAAVSANVLKPLTLTRLQDLDLGTITLKAGSWSGATVAISRAGVFSCTNANTVCTGARQVAKYNVQGSNKGVVQITAPNVTLVNQTDATKTLILAVDSPGTLSLPNSGAPGVDFSLGGSISVSGTTADGLYTGTFSVTVDYQ